MSQHQENSHQDIPSHNSEVVSHHSPEEQINQFVEDSLQERRETFDRQSFQKKCHYLKSLQNSNHSLFCKIKQIDEKLNNQVNRLSRKHVGTKKAPHVPRLDEMQTQEIRHKYSCLEACRNELQLKKIAHDSLIYLSKIKEDLSNKQATLNKEINQQKQHLKRLNKIKQKQLKQEGLIQTQISSVGDIDIYDTELTDLRARIKSTTIQIKANKDRFISRHQKKTNVNISTKTIQPEVVDQELLELKKCYEAAGKRIEALKAVKAQKMGKMQKLGKK